MELEKAIENIKIDIATPLACGECTICNIEDLETLLNHLTKQKKMIELMARFIDTELSSEHLSKVLKIDVKPLETYREDIKQYFEKKVEENK